MADVPTAQALEDLTGSFLAADVDDRAVQSRVAIRVAEHVTAQQQKTRADRGWKSEGIVYVFGTRYGTAQQAQVIRNQFRSVVTKAGIRGSWTPRELRHSFVSLMSDSGASQELIADLVGHAHTTTTRTRTIYRHQLRPVITKGAEMLDEAFGKGFLDDE